MEDRKLDRNLIFFTPGKPGGVFTFQAGNTVNNDLLNIQRGRHPIRRAQ
jgi:hypothetical protein